LNAFTSRVQTPRAHPNPTKAPPGEREVGDPLAAVTLALVAFALYEKRSTRSGEPE
jgi:hypothetical protein